jgi:hypothetical protein
MPYYKGSDGSVYHAMFPIEGQEPCDGPVRSADGIDNLAPLRLIKAEAVDGQPFKHCGLCIKMISAGCAASRRCLHETFLTGTLPSEIDWFIKEKRHA